MVGCLAVKSVGGDLRDPPGCLFFPVVWASEPARSGDETTWFLTQKPSRPTPQPLTDFNIRLKRPPPNRLAPLRLQGFGWGRRGGGRPLIGAACMNVDSGWGLGQISGLAGAAGGWPIPIWRRIKMGFRLASCRLDAVFKIASLQSL